MLFFLALKYNKYICHTVITYQSPDERTFKIVVLRTFSDLFLKYFNFDDFIEFIVFNFTCMLMHLISLYKMCVTHVFKAKPIPTKYVCKNS